MQRTRAWFTLLHTIGSHQRATITTAVAGHNKNNGGANGVFDDSRPGQRIRLFDGINDNNRVRATDTTYVRPNDEHLQESGLLRSVPVVHVCGRYET